MSVLIDGNGFQYSTNGTTPQRKELAEMAYGGQDRFRKVNASYDGARDTQEYQATWANVDALSADAANSKGVRERLVQRSRYEAGSNGYYDGILNTHTNMLVGVGPKLRMTTSNEAHNELVETAWKQWVKLTGFRSSLWTMSHAKTQDGETFGVLQNNPEIDFDVQLDILPLETEQIQSRFGITSERNADGVHFDQYDNIIFYEVLPFHPGGTDYVAQQNPVNVPASAMTHWLRRKRPGTHRAVPEFQSTLNSGVSFRRLREATLATAETVADYSILLKTMAPPNDESALPTPMSSLPIQKRMMVALPDSTEPFQLKSEQPGNTYESFHRSLLSEQARPKSMPYNAAACDSSTYSFASGKLDFLCYRAELDIERVECNEMVLDPVFEAWYAELALARGLDPTLTAHECSWPAHPVIDTKAEAEATDRKLKNGTTTLRKVYADAGEDFDEQLQVMTKDYFGEATDENVQEMRAMLRRVNFPSAPEPITEPTEPIPEPV